MDPKTWIGKLPISDPNPASVTTKPFSPTNFNPMRSATTEEHPWAMLAKGPAWTNTGVPSRVCINVGSILSRKRTARAPVIPCNTNRNVNFSDHF